MCWFSSCTLCAWAGWYPVLSTRSPSPSGPIVMAGPAGVLPWAEPHLGLRAVCLIPCFLASRGRVMEMGNPVCYQILGSQCRPPAPCKGRLLSWVPQHTQRNDSLPTEYPRRRTELPARGRVGSQAGRWLSTARTAVASFPSVSPARCAVRGRQVPALDGWMDGCVTA